MFLADGESGAEVNCGAKTKTQAEEVFNPARLMLLQNPALLAKYQPDIKVESIKLADGGTFKTIVGVPIDGGSALFSMKYISTTTAIYTSRNRPDWVHENSR